MKITASYLLDDNTEVGKHLELALRIAEIKQLSESSNIAVPFPKSAIEFAEGALGKWLDDVARFARNRRDIPYLADRGEHLSNVWDSELSWNQGISSQELHSLYQESFEYEQYDDTYPTLGGKGPLADYIRRQLTDDILSGHYNRFLPMKLSLRVLMNLIFARETYEGEEEWMEERAEVFIDELRENSLNVALYAKKWFSTIDARSGKTIGEEITVGFPDEKIKSQERFLTQFVGSTRSRGKGALCEMGFMLVNEDGSIELTYEGLQFAMAPNPMIDMTPEGGKGERMSESERLILGSHIQMYLPAEWGLMKMVAESIYELKNNPKLLDSLIETEYEIEANKSNNIRNGVVSRMQELGFLTRKKEGRNVTYILTENGIERLIDANL